MVTRRSRSPPARSEPLTLPRFGHYLPDRLGKFPNRSRSGRRAAVAAPDTTPGTPRLLRTINDRSALELLLEHGPLTRTRLGALTGLSKPTASQMIDRLLTAELVVAAGTASGGPGANVPLYAGNPAAVSAGGHGAPHGSRR